MKIIILIGQSSKNMVHVRPFSIQCGAMFTIEKLVNITSITVYDTYEILLNYSIHRVYKPTNRTFGGPTLLILVII